MECRGHSSGVCEGPRGDPLVKKDEPRDQKMVLRGTLWAWVAHAVRPWGRGRNGAGLVHRRGHARRRGILLQDARVADWEIARESQRFPGVCACHPRLLTIGNRVGHRGCCFPSGSPKRERGVSGSHRDGAGLVRPRTLKGLVAPAPQNPSRPQMRSPCAAAVYRSAHENPGWTLFSGGPPGFRADRDQGRVTPNSRIMLPLSATSKSGRYGLARPRRERPAG